MRKSFYAFVALIFAFCISCEKDDTPEDFWIDATVLRASAGCDTWFIEDNNKVDTENELGIFSEINLPDKYKVEDLELKLKIRKPKPEETFPCLAIDVRYPFRVVTQVKEK